MKNIKKLLGVLVVLPIVALSQDYPIAGTNQTESYNNNAVISLPVVGDDYFGQNSNHEVILPSYTDNENGIITDNITGLLWQQNMGVKVSYDDAFTIADTMTLGGFTDWRVPMIKELNSIVDYY